VAELIAVPRYAPWYVLECGHIRRRGSPKSPTWCAWCTVEDADRTLRRVTERHNVTESDGDHGNPQ
jgi:hypothetical protein